VHGQCTCADPQSTSQRASQVADAHYSRSPPSRLAIVISGQGWPCYFKLGAPSQAGACAHYLACTHMRMRAPRVEGPSMRTVRRRGVACVTCNCGWCQCRLFQDQVAAAVWHPGPAGGPPLAAQWAPRRRGLRSSRPARMVPMSHQVTVAAGRCVGGRGGWWVGGWLAASHHDASPMRPAAGDPCAAPGEDPTERPTQSTAAA
jgi:hypothetical protein